MRMYHILVFVIIMNLTIAIVNKFDFITTTLQKPVTVNSEDWVDKAKTAERDTTSAVNQSSGLFSSVVGAVDKVTDSVFLTLKGTMSFLKLFADSTIFAGATYWQFICTYPNAPCIDNNSSYTVLWYIWVAMTSLTYFLYTVALIQFVKGQSLEEGV